PRRYRAEVVRLVCGDTGPGGPGLKTVRLPTSIEGEHDGTPQLIDAGSYAIVEHPEAFGALGRFTLQAFIQPTLVPVRPSPRRQVVMGTWAEDRGSGFALMLDETGALAFLIGAAPVSTGTPLTARRWYHVAASVDLAAGTVTLRQTPLADHAPSLEQPVAITTAIRAAPGPAGDFFIGAARKAVEDGRLRTTWHFNGKIDRPSLLAGEQPIGLWDFAADGGPEFWVVFYVRPPRGGPRARAAFLASTATYLCYSNYRMRMRPGPAELFIGALPIVDTTDLLLMHHPALGASTYDTHSDGSGVCHVSRLRPIVNVRPTGRLWNLFLDLCLLDWLEAHEQRYDVITDDDLHTEGLPLLDGYSVVLTGCHPEYVSREMMEALAAYLGRGGRLMYMGGNGFYWRVSYPRAQPG